MKTKIFAVFIVSLLLAIGAVSCSKKEFNPEDYATSWLSGEYGKKQVWKLNVTVNGEQTDDYDYVRFDSKVLKTGDFRFVNVIPGEKRKEFKNVPLTVSEDGVNYSIEYDRGGSKITVSGLVMFGEMTVNITM